MPRSTSRSVLELATPSFALPVVPLSAQSPEAIPARFAEVANRIIAAALTDSAGAYNRIAELTDRLVIYSRGHQHLSRQ